MPSVTAMLNNSFMASRGGVAANMVVWRMADGRYLSIMPSALEMPEGMNSYNVLSEKQKLQKVVKLLPFGAIELKDDYK